MSQHLEDIPVELGKLYYLVLLYYYLVKSLVGAEGAVLVLL